MNKPIYFDYNATTPVDPKVLEAMMPFFTEVFGNPSSLNHSYGGEAHAGLEKARNQAAQLIGCAKSEVFWTSGATESNNMALRGVVNFFRKTNTPIHIVTSSIEHKSVLDVARKLQDENIEVTFVAPNREGQITLESVQKAITPHTRLISLFLAQNEVGSITDVGSIGELARSKGILFHVDGAQAVGKIPVNVVNEKIDFLSASGHKLYAPKGVGFLYVRKGTQIEPLFWGGKQEGALRPGTQNLPGIVGMGAACELCAQLMDEEISKTKSLQSKLISTVMNKSNRVILNGPKENRLPSNVSFSFEGIKAASFELYLGDLALSSGSACSMGEPSYVLKALGHSDELARSTIRLGIGRYTTEQDIEFAAERIVNLLEKNQSQSFRAML